MTVASTIAALSGLPAEMVALKRWVCWKRTKEGIRLPIDCKTKRLAKSNDKATWSRFGDAVRLYATGRFDGVSFALGDGIFGIDLDACISEDGELAPWAEKVLGDFRTYAELSPSGVGIKVYGFGTYTGTGISCTMGESQGGKRPAIEINGWGKFFAVTGRAWPESPLRLLSCRMALEEITQRLAKPPVPLPAREYVTLTPMLLRAGRWLEKVDGAISGKHGHSATFRVACRLIGKFGLSREECYALLVNNYNERCDPPWSERELIHKVKEAWRKYGHSQPAQ